MQINTSSLITYFCLVDDIIKQIPIENKRQKPLQTDSELIFIAIISCFFFKCNYKMAVGFSNLTKLTKVPISYNRFIKRINNKSKLIKVIMEIISNLSEEYDFEKTYIVDAKSIQLAKNYRKPKNFKDSIEHKGYSASKKLFYTGFQLHLIISLNKKIPICFEILPAKIGEREALKTLSKRIQPNSTILGDKGYVGNDLEQYLKDIDINLVTLKRKHSLKKLGLQHNPIDLIRKRHFIEKFFADLSFIFPDNRNYVSINGLINKLNLSLLALSLKNFSKQQ